MARASTQKGSEIPGILGILATPEIPGILGILEIPGIPGILGILKIPGILGTLEIPGIPELGSRREGHAAQTGLFQMGGAQ